MLSDLKHNVLNEPLCAELQFLIQLWLLLKTGCTSAIQKQKTCKNPVRAVCGCQELQVSDGSENPEKNIWSGFIPALSFF